MSDVDEVVTVTLRIDGIVQGVGFRPFVFRLAQEHEISGWIRNDDQGVFIQATAKQTRIHLFCEKIKTDAPAIARIKSIRQVALPAEETPTGFRILPSETSARIDTVISPDLALCSDCQNELLDPSDRRYRYPFINCINCGPRFSIIEAMPYDRCNTAMRIFPMCEKCDEEYHDPSHRRFHAQANACPICGPQLELLDARGNKLKERHAALGDAVKLIQGGSILAVKGVGGFHLVTGMDDEKSVRILRQRKRRPDKPFAVMMRSIEEVEKYCHLSILERDILTSPQAPIVLLKRLNADTPEIASSIAPHNPYLGVMLPYTPLHRLLLDEIGKCIVATSGNLSDEPICIDEYEALDRLAKIADYFLVHNRPIVRPLDDSIVQVVAGKIMILRSGRGYAPQSISLEKTHSSGISVGAHLKTTLSITTKSSVTMSQHIGDLETAQAQYFFKRTYDDLKKLFQVDPQHILHDAHPDYPSTAMATKSNLSPHSIQHHHAHALSCMLEHGLFDHPVLAVIWDGTGYGFDSQIWGGEFFRVYQNEFHRVACLRSFPLLGGDAAVKEPRRAAIGILYELLGFSLFTDKTWQTRLFKNKTEMQTFERMLQQKINCPRTTSAGRLFDAIAFLIGTHRDLISFEGQAAMSLEFAATTGTAILDSILAPKFIKSEDPNLCVLEWAPLVQSLCNQNFAEMNDCALTIHERLSQSIIEAVNSYPEKDIILSGGCFQNRLLLNCVIQKLQLAGKNVFWNQYIPINDGGISAGQAAMACYL